MEEALREAGETEHLQWDEDKDSRVDFDKIGRENFTGGKTLGLEICANLDFRKHIESRAAMAKAVLGAFSRIANYNGGISGRAGRQLYTGMIPPIMTYMAEVWRREGDTRAQIPLDLVNAKALRRVTRASRGSSREALEWIANVEPLDLFFRGTQKACGRRAVRNGTHR